MKKCYEQGVPTINEARLLLKEAQEVVKQLESCTTMEQEVIINGIGHLPNLDEPEMFSEIVLDFLMK